MDVVHQPGASILEPFLPHRLHCLVAIASVSHPIPSRTRPGNLTAPMVLSLKRWKSRSSPGIAAGAATAEIEEHIYKSRICPRSLELCKAERLPGPRT